MTSSESLEYTFRLYQGASEYPIIAFYSHYIDDSNKTPIDLTDYSIEMTMKSSFTKKPIDYLTTDNGRIVFQTNTIDDVEYTNAIELQFPSDITSDYQYPEYVYDIYAINNDNDKTLLLYGKIIMLKGVSHVF